MDDNDLTELLELADEDQPLPDDLEDRLLADIVVTYRQSIDLSNLEVDQSAEDSDAVVLDLDSGEAFYRREGSGFRRWLLAGAAAVALALVFLVRDDEDAVRTANPPDPTVAESIPTVIGELSHTAVCDALETAIASAGLVGPLTLIEDLDPAALERVALAARELAERGSDDAGATVAADIVAIGRLAAAVENLRLELEGGTAASAEAAYRPTREETNQSAAARSRLCSSD